MGRISMIDPQTAPENVQEVIRRHLAGGHQLTNEKRTLLHNVNAFLAIEEASYTRTFSNTRFPYPMSASSAQRILAGSCGRNIIWTLRILS